MRARRWALGGLAALVLAALAAVAGLAWRGAAEPALDTTPAAPVTPELLARGAYLAQVGHCAGCHTARGGAPYAGGRALATPFGTVVAGNLTPDVDTGLGAWTAQDFRRALWHGRSRDGRLLLPAFPFTEFTHITREDADALYAWLRTLPPVRRANAPHALRFPYGTALAQAVWRALYFRPQRFEREMQRTPAWNRGAYLVRGLGHCASCHAPRNALGATQDSQSLAGGIVSAGPWRAPPLGGLRRSETIALLRDGVTAQRAVSGPMAEVVRGSTQHWLEADLIAVATYLESLPAPAAPEPAAPAVAEQLAAGRKLYDDLCADCHGPRGEGAARAVPALAGNPAVAAADPANLVLAVQHGGFPPSTAGNPRPYGMPPMALDDAEVAAVLTYVRQSWGHQAGALSALDVRRLR